MLLISLVASGAFLAGALFWVAVAGWMESKRERAERERCLYRVEF